VEEEQRTASLMARKTSFFWKPWPLAFLARSHLSERTVSPRLACAFLNSANSSVRWPLGDRPSRPTLKGKDNGRRRRNGLLGRHPVQRAVQCRRHAVRAPSGVCVSDQRLGILS
jgi:hypothetical protein